MIAMALAGGANFLIADEPTTSLDVTIQEEIICLLEDLRESAGLSIMFISHDLGLVARLCDRVAVMYAGEIVEMGRAEDIIMSPQHPYTRGLMSAVPDMTQIGKLQHGIPGTPPMIGAWPSGCRFQPRCRYALEQCGTRQVLTSDEVPTSSGLRT
jgi:peptide/nickel transport system permease protein